MLGEGQLIRELKLEEIYHCGMRKWIKTVYVPGSTYHVETFLPQRMTEITYRACF
jgi:hypothetical protein